MFVFDVVIYSALKSLLSNLNIWVSEGPVSSNGLFSTSELLYPDFFMHVVVVNPLLDIVRYFRNSGLYFTLQESVVLFVSLFVRSVKQLIQMCSHFQRQQVKLLLDHLALVVPLRIHTVELIDNS